MKITSLLGTAALGASIALGGAAACAVGDDTVEVAEYDACDLEDQAHKEDECGYWQKGTQYYVGAQPDFSWVWIWYSFVTIGRHSVPYAGWIPPKGVPTPPVKIVQRPKSKVCAMAPQPPRPPAPAPKVNNPAPAKPPVNVPKQPAKPYTPPKPGARPAGC